MHRDQMMDSVWDYIFSQRRLEQTAATNIALAMATTASGISYVLFFQGTWLETKAKEKSVSTFYATINGLLIV